METPPSINKSTFKHSSRKRSSRLCIASVGILMMGAVPFASADDQFVSSGDFTFSTEKLYTGGNFVPQGNAFENSEQREAFLVIGGDTVTFANGADIKIQNGENRTTFIRVGNNNSNGTLNIEEGATLAVGSTTRYANFQIGNWGGTGVVNQSGGNVTVIGSFEVGNQGGTGTYHMTGGTLTLGVIEANNTGNYSLARSGTGVAASHGTFRLDGGNLNLVTGYMTLSSRTTGTSGQTQGTGTLTQTSGTFTVSNATQLAFTGENASGEGIYNLNGGTLAVGGHSLRAEYDRVHSESTHGSYKFNLGGGKIKVIDSNLQTAVNATFVENTTSEIDTNGFDATWSGSLTGDGNLKKTGTGELTLSGSSNTYTGTTEITAGTLLVSSRTGSGDVTIRAGATLSGTGIVAGAATIEGKLAPAALTFEKGLTLESTASTVMEIAGLNVGEFDAITVTEGNFILGGGLTLSIITELQFGDSLNLFDLDASVDPSSNFDWVTLAGDYGSGSFTWIEDRWLATLDGAYFTFDVATGLLSFEAIPEPGSWALLAGGTALTCWLRRRKKA